MSAVPRSRAALAVDGAILGALVGGMSGALLGGMLWSLKDRPGSPWKLGAGVFGVCTLTGAITGARSLGSQFR
jgi:hypothetical protein